MKAACKDYHVVFFGQEGRGMMSVAYALAALRLGWCHLGSEYVACATLDLLPVSAPESKSGWAS